MKLLFSVRNLLLGLIYVIGYNCIVIFVTDESEDKPDDLLAILARMRGGLDGERERIEGELKAQLFSEIMVRLHFTAIVRTIIMNIIVTLQEDILAFDKDIDIL